MRAARPRSATFASVPARRWRSAMIPAASCARPTAPASAHSPCLGNRRAPRCGDRARLLLRAARRRPGHHAEGLLHPRADCPDRVRVLRLGCVEGARAPAHACSRRRSRELRGDPPGRDLRRAHARDRLDVGARLVGDLVDVELEPARDVPDPVPLLLGLLHAALLGRPGAGAGEHVRGVRALRRCADPRQLALDPPCERLHPPDGVYAARAADDRLDVLHLLRLLGGSARARVDDVPRGAGREALGRAAARASRASGVTSGEKYVAAAYLVVFVAVLAWVAIMAAKVARLSNEVEELVELARSRERDAA